MVLEECLSLKQLLIEGLQELVEPLVQLEVLERLKVEQRLLKLSSPTLE
jgi:hypothetical protein